MNISIDIGNTRTKAGIFDGRTLKEKRQFSSRMELETVLSSQQFENAIISSVGLDADEMVDLVNVAGLRLSLSHSLSLPVNIRYGTPHTLGVDRIAAVCGAWDLFPNQKCLVIDAGTCITYEWLDAQGNYFGGSISPGLEMRLKAMHSFTARLPLVPVETDIELLGGSTKHAMQSGAWYGVVSEINGMIERYVDTHGPLQVVLCGGDAPLFENKLKHTIFAAPDLVLSGLNRILLHNADR